MSDVWIRLGLITVVLGLGLIVGAALHIRDRRRPAPIDVTGLAPGVYFFSSATCHECLPARDLIEAALGPEGFVEVKWEEQPATFAEIGIEEVPATIVVEEDRPARLFTGIPVGAF
ncbi:MAG: hypothetical protein ACRDZM_19375 [Acidimicrobiia bacterium]